MPKYGETKVSTLSEFNIPAPTLAPGQRARLWTLEQPKGDVLSVTATDPHGEEIFTWAWPVLKDAESAVPQTEEAFVTKSETDTELTVTAGPATYIFSKKSGFLQQVKTVGHTYSLVNGPRFVAAKRSDRSQDGFYNHDDKEAFQKKTLYTEYEDQGAFSRFVLDKNTLTAYYEHGSLCQTVWKFQEDGSVRMEINAGFNGVVDLMGICFDYPEAKVSGKRWVGRGPYRVWQNRMEGPQYGYYETAYNDPIPGESWEYPEFKGYFADVSWMQLDTQEGRIGIEPEPANTCEHPYIGVFTPRDGRDHLLYDLPKTGLSLLSVIPAVRNKVNTTDLNGPSAQPHFVSGTQVYSAKLRFE
jgi:hypothetical protein